MIWALLYAKAGTLMSSKAPQAECRVLGKRRLCSELKLEKDTCQESPDKGREGRPPLLPNQRVLLCQEEGHDQAITKASAVFDLSLDSTNRLERRERQREREREIDFLCTGVHGYVGQCCTSEPPKAP